MSEFDPHNTAQELAKSLVEVGCNVSDVDFSTNRHGQKSAYFTARSGRFYWTVRVSDHQSNSVMANCQIFTDEQAKQFLEFVSGALK